MGEITTNCKTVMTRSHSGLEYPQEKCTTTEKNAKGDLLWTIERTEDFDGFMQRETIYNQDGLSSSDTECDADNNCHKGASSVTRYMTPSKWEQEDERKLNIKVLGEEAGGNLNEVNSRIKALKDKIAELNLQSYEEPQNTNIDAKTDLLLDDLAILSQYKKAFIEKLKN